MTDLTREDVARLRELLARFAEYCDHSRNGSDEACSDHPDAPHGFDRTGSHSLDRYVCDCEGWDPDPADDLILRRDAVAFIREQGPALLALAEAVAGAPEVRVEFGGCDCMAGEVADVVGEVPRELNGQRVRLLRVEGE